MWTRDTDELWDCLKREGSKDEQWNKGKGDEPETYGKLGSGESPGTKGC